MDEESREKKEKEKWKNKEKKILSDWKSSKKWKGLKREIECMKDKEKEER